MCGRVEDCETADSEGLWRLCSWPWCSGEFWGLSKTQINARAAVLHVCHHPFGDYILDVLHTRY